MREQRIFLWKERLIRDANFVVRKEEKSSPYILYDRRRLPIVGSYVLNERFKAANFVWLNNKSQGSGDVHIRTPSVRKRCSSNDSLSLGSIGRLFGGSSGDGSVFQTVAHVTQLPEEKPGLRASDDEESRE